tara:strand:+ start:801 stop:1433 length:633 start_codon:yes stop_codon:yes gene_type:complete
MSLVYNKINNQKIICVLEIVDLDSINPVCEALIEGGVNIIELALRTSVSERAAVLIKKNYPEITIGLGTVINTDQVKFALDSGIEFAVSPGTNPKVIDFSLKSNLPFYPGVSSPSDIEIAVSHGCRLLKFFPAASLGGIEFLKSINSPYKYLNLKYIPLGGINHENFKDYLSSDIVLGVGGSWIASKKLISSFKWDIIKKNAQEAKKLLI